MNGDEIRRRRELANMSQKELADALGVDTKTVNNWENARSTPRNATSRIKKLLPEEPVSPGLGIYEDTELLAELMTRALSRGKKQRVPALRPVPDRPDFPDGQPLAARSEPPQDAGHDQR